MTLGGHLKRHMDHIIYGKYTYYFKYPGKLPEDSEIEMFSDGLEETIPAKLQEFMERQDFLWEEYKVENKIIEGLVFRGEIDSFSQYFWTYWIELKFMEYVVINKWIRYYLELALKISPSTSWHLIKSDNVSDEDLRRAKASLIEDMYDGNLRGIGQRLVGKCPFHEEKTPSFTIFRNDNRFFCFGCQKRGDSIDFYMSKNKGISLKDAIQALK